MGIWLVSQCFSGLSNAVSGYIFGNDQFQVTDKVSRNGASGGESTSKLGYLSDLISRQPKSGQMGDFPGGAVTRTPYERLMDPRGTCILQDVFGGGLGVRKAYGYRYEMRDPEQPERDGFDLGDLFRSTLIGGLMGGLSGVAFYGMDKAVKALKGSLSGGGKGKRTELFLPDEYYQKMDDNIVKAMAARDAEVMRLQRLSMSQRQKNNHRSWRHGHTNRRSFCW